MVNVRPFVLPALAVAGLALAGWTVVQGAKPMAVAQPIAAPAETPFALTVAGAGIVEAGSDNFSLGTQLAGIVQAIAVKVGDEVKADALLVQLDDRPQRAAVQLAEAHVAEITAALADVQSQWTAVEKLTDTRAVSAEERTRRKQALAIAAARQAGAGAELAQAQAAVAQLAIHAPIAGTILQVNTRAGEFVSGAAGPLLVLGRTDVLRVRVDIDENDAWRIRAGAKAHAFVRGNRDLSVDLTFDRIEPYVVPKRSLTGASSERVDTRVLQVLYSFPGGKLPVFVGQLMDVFIDAAPVSPVTP